MPYLSYCISYGINSAARYTYFCMWNNEETTFTENYCKHLHLEEHSSHSKSWKYAG